MAGRGDVKPSGFGPMLRRVREEKGFTQAGLGAAADLHANTVARLERGEVEPSWPVVLKLAKALGVDCTAFSVPAGASPPGADPDPAADKAEGSNLVKRGRKSGGDR